MAPPTQPAMTRLALIEQKLDGLDTKLDDVLRALEAQSRRLHEIETKEVVCRSEMAGLPQRVRYLEDERERQRGALRVVQWAAGGGGLLGFLALLAQLLTLVWGK